MKKIGELAFEEKWLSEKELEKFLGIQAQRRKQGISENESKLGQILLEFGILEESILQQLLKKQISLLKEKPTPITTIQKGSEFPENKIIELDRYEILEELGKGGMGVVQLVKDNLLGREVALKTIHFEQHQLETLAEKQKLLLWRLKQEASITAILEHPNIVPLYDMQQKENGNLQFTMRKVQGETLRSLFQKQRNGEIDYNKATFLSIFLKVCDGMAYAHSRGIIHRDLKPENIMVGEFGEVYIVDWGIAKKLKNSQNNIFSKLLEKAQKRFAADSFDRLFSYNTVGGLGTKGYMAPEQKLAAAKATEKSDIYALGRILEECYTFLSPIEKYQKLAKRNKIQSNISEKQALENTSDLNQLKDVQSIDVSLRETKTKELEEKPQFISKSEKKNKLIPKELAQIVQAATHQEIEKRYQSVEELKTDLNNFLNEKDGERFKLPFFKKCGIFIKNYPRLTSVVVMLLLFLGGTFNFFYKELHFLKIQAGNSLRTLKIDEAIEIYERAKPYAAWLGQEKNIEEILDTLQVYKNSQKTMGHVRYTFYTNQILVNVATKLKIAENPRDLLKETLNQFKSIQKQLNSHKELLEFAPLLKHFSLCFLEVEILNISTFPNSEKLFKNFTKKSRLLKEQLKTISNVPLIRLACECALKETNEFKKFEKIIEEIISEKPDSFWMHMIKSIFFHRTNQIELAKQTFLTCLALDPENLLPYTFLADIEANKGNSKQALKYVYKVIQKEEGSYFPIYLFLDYLFCLENLKDNQKQITIKSTPKSSKDFYQQGIFEFRQYKFKEAYKNFDRAIQLNSQLFEAYNYRGFLELKERKFKEAFKDFSTAIQLNPNFFRPYNNRGVANLIINKIDEAEEDLRKSIQLNPDNIRGYYLLGVLYKTTKRFEEAIEILKKGLKTQKNKALLATLVATLLESGTLYYEKKAYQLAEKNLVDFKKYAPKNHPKHTKINKIILKIKMKEHF